MNNDKLLTSMIIEGFICPECQQDMSSIELLQTHFELFHLNNNKKSNQSDSSNKKLPSKAADNAGENVVISQSAATVNPINTQNSSQYFKDFFNSNQTDGLFRIHTNEYKKQRDATIGRYVVQTNKLLITLDKLISIDSSLLSNEHERESHYKSIVSWVDDRDVSLCPNCAKSFNLLYRKHHCRLCGAIMCNKCSQFISFSLAKQLTDPDTFVKAISANEKNSSPNEFKLRRSDSITSLNSYFFKPNNNNKSQPNEPSTNDAYSGKNKLVNLEQYYLRLCFDCGVTLEKKYKSFKDKMIRPHFSNLYDQLHAAICESQRLYPIFTRMAESLNNGESVHQLSNAEDMRHTLIRLFQSIETISGNILKYDMKESENGGETNHDHMKLQRNIRFYAISYLKEHSFNLSSLPNKQEYEKLKSQRQVYLKEEMRRVELEQLKQKQQLNDQMVKRQQKGSSNRKSVNLNNEISPNENSKAKISIDNSNGWIPSIKPSTLLEDVSDKEDNDAEEETDEDGSKSISSKKSSSNEQEKALRIQIQLVEGYLQDAIKHNKQDEAKLLQQNLNELLNTLVGK